MELSILIVHHDAHEYLQSCLRSIPQAAAELAHEIIVTDNASPDMDALVRNFPRITWLMNKENVGWGAAINQAAAKSHGDILVLLNPDCELLSNSLKKIHAFFNEKKDQLLGPVGGKLLFSDGSTQPSCGPRPSLVSMLWRRLLLPPMRRKYYFCLPESGASRVDWVTGAFLAIRRRVFEELGGFDDRFFLYYEDTDLCIRARQKGYSAYYWPEAAAYHHHPHAVRPQLDPRLQRIIQDSRLRYFQKHRPSWEAWTLQRLQHLEKI